MLVNRCAPVPKLKLIRQDTRRSEMRSIGRSSALAVACAMSRASAAQKHTPQSHFLLRFSERCQAPAIIQHRWTSIFSPVIACSIRRSGHPSEPRPWKS